MTYSPKAKGKQPANSFSSPTASSPQQSNNAQVKPKHQDTTKKDPGFDLLAALEYPNSTKVHYVDPHGVSHKEAEDKDINLPPKFHVAPHEYDLAGKPGQKKPLSDYEKKVGESHYMSGLTLSDEQFEKRMQVESGEEKVHGHSGGYFESKYTDAQRESYDIAKDYGTDITGKGTAQTFHHGRHNPYQSDANLKGRVTDGVLPDGEIGAFSAISSKFLSDENYIEAFDEAKKAATDAYKKNTLPKDSKGYYYNQYTVVFEHQKPMGEGFEGDNSQPTTKNHVTDIFNNTSTGKKKPTLYTATNAVGGSNLTASQTGLILKNVSASGPEWEVAPSQHYPAKTQAGTKGVVKIQEFKNGGISKFK